MSVALQVIVMKVAHVTQRLREFCYDSSVSYSLLGGRVEIVFHQRICFIDFIRGIKQSLSKFFKPVICAIQTLSMRLRTAFIWLDTSSPQVKPKEGVMLNGLYVGIA